MLANAIRGTSNSLNFSITEIGQGCGFSTCPDLSIKLQDIAQNITILARQANDAHTGRRPVLNLRPFHISLLLLGHRLIQFSPLAGARSIGDIDNTVQLGLVAFLMPFMHHLDGTIPNNPLLSHLIQSTIRHSSSTTTHELEIALWALFMAAASVFSQHKYPWLVSSISQIIESLNLHSWDEVHSRMGRYPWVDAIHSKTAESLCGF